MIQLERLFLTGVPGSKWSGIAQILEQIPDFNTSDRTPERTFSHAAFGGHKGAYFGRGMEFGTDIEGLPPNELSQYLNLPFEHSNGIKIIKSHDWAYKLPFIKKTFPNDWIMLVYRPDMVSYAWWHQAGGFDIAYPNYDDYSDSNNMLTEIYKQNDRILKFGKEHNAQWSHFSNEWVINNFNFNLRFDYPHHDILVTLIK